MSSFDLWSAEGVVGLSSFEDVLYRHVFLVFNTLYAMIDESKRLEIWNRLRTVSGKDPDEFRLDPCGALIRWSKYGDRSDDYGWEVDHVIPKIVLSRRGVVEEEIDDLVNLRPMQWKNNDAKATDYPAYHTMVKYDGSHNVSIEGVFEVNRNLQRELSIKYSRYGI